MGNCVEKSKEVQGFEIPSDLAIKGVADQGWQVSTVVGTSNISGAGNGRFAKEKIAKGTKVIIKKLRPMASIDTLAEVPYNTTITFSSVDDLEKYIKLAETEGGYTRDKILDLFEHFIYAMDGKVCCLNMCTWTVNHSDTYDNGLNVLVMVDQKQPDGSIAYVGEAMCDIKKGDEFFMDYRRFNQPKFYVEFTKKLSYMDVRKATLHAVYGSDDDAKIYAESQPLNAYGGFALPSDNAIKGAADQGWQCSTKVGTSKIPGAGNGRFAEQKIRKGSQVIIKTLRPMAKIDTLLQGLPADTTITFASVDDLEKYIKLAETQGGYSRKEILHLFEHFIYAMDGKVCCLNVSTWTVNHSDTYENGLNVLVMTDQTLPDGSIAYVGEAMCDIQKGDEFYMDYRRFEQPEFYVEFTNKLSYMDVRKATLHAVYGSDDDDKIYAENKPINEYAGGGQN